MSKKNWYVKFPTFRYVEDVKAIAKKNDLRIIDAKYQGDKKQCDPVPELTLVSEKNDEDEKLKSLKEEAQALNVPFSPNIGYVTLLERVEEARG